VVLADRREATVLAAIEKHAEDELEPPVLIATGDPDIRFLAHNRERLHRHFRFVAPPSDSTEILTDKARFADFVEKHGFPAPATVVVRTDRDIERAIDTLSFPLIIKPALSSNWRAPKFFRRLGNIKVAHAASAEYLRKFWTDLGDSSGALIVQERIPGADDQQYHYFSYRNRDGSEITGLVARRLRIFPIHGGVGSFVIAEEHPEVARLARNILDALDFSGPSSVCFKRDSETGDFKIFEINGRMPMAHSVLQMCGVDLPGIYYSDAIGRAIVAPRPRNLGCKWMALEMDLRASFDYWKAGELSIAGYFRSLAKTRAVIEFAYDDWGPFWHALHGIGKAVGGGMRRAGRRWLPSLRTGSG